MPPNPRPTANGFIIAVYVHPSAKKDCIAAGDEIEVFTREPAENNRANLAVLKSLSKALGVPRSNVSIVRGFTGRVKELHVANASPSLLKNLYGKEVIEKSDR